MTMFRSEMKDGKALWGAVRYNRRQDYMGSDIAMAPAADLVKMRSIDFHGLVDKI